MSFKRFDFYSNQKVRNTLYSKGGTIDGDVVLNGDININGNLQYNNINPQNFDYNIGPNNDGNGVLNINTTLQDNNYINFIENDIRRWTFRQEGIDGEKLFIVGDNSLDSKIFTLVKQPTTGLTGKCGINQPNPTQSLDVSGNIYVSGNIIIPSLPTTKPDISGALYYDTSNNNIKINL